MHGVGAFEAALSPTTRAASSLGRAMHSPHSATPISSFPVGDAETYITHYRLCRRVSPTGVCNAGIAARFECRCLGATDSAIRLRHQLCLRSHQIKSILSQFALTGVELPYRVSARCPDSSAAKLAEPSRPAGKAPQSVWRANMHPLKALNHLTPIIHVGRLLRILIPVFATLSLTGCPTFPLVPIVPSQPGAWLVFLCRAADAPDEPHTTEYFNDLFVRENDNLVHDFLERNSHGRIDVSGTAVFGWFRMAVKRADIAPDVRNNGTNPNRSRTVEDCKTAGFTALLAEGRAIIPDQYAGFIAVINVPVDAGQVGGSIVANQDEPVSFFEHEMLHVYGLDDSFNLGNDSTEDHSWGSSRFERYSDCWDIMSYATCAFSFDTRTHGSTGPGLNLAYQSLLGWLESERIVTKVVKSSADRVPLTVTLSAVSEPERSGPMMAVVRLPHGVRYAIEFRKNTGFDSAIPRSEVVIREWRSDGRTYLIRQKDGRIGRVPGPTFFTDTRNFLSIRVDAIAPTGGATLTIDPSYSPIGRIDDANMQINSAPSSLRDGQSGSVSVTSTNIGSTTWSTPSHGLILRGGLHISLPHANKPISGSVAPGQSQTFNFDVVCNGQGQGFFEAQMGGEGGVFGQSAGRTVICQP